ncbi:hypothetical protein [Ferrovibrio sp.]|jgi:hypothetical protein|uniref:hypothetical protein n=1 Tax=Ferrovibrio sp. TaxID=1917215 RepID=UPI0035B19B80
MSDLLHLAALRDTTALPGSGLPGYPQSALLNQAYALWLTACGTREMPAWPDVTERHPDLLHPQTLLLSVQQEPLDFRYELIGSRIQAILNTDYTGMTLSQVPHQRPPSLVWDHLAAAVDARAPIKGVVPYVGRSRDVGGIFHIVLPLSDDGVTVDRVLVCVDLAPPIRLQDGTPPFTQLG